MWSKCGQKVMILCLKNDEFGTDFDSKPDHASDDVAYLVTSYDSRR
jgi:hypothetical protein